MSIPDWAKEILERLARVEADVRGLRSAIERLNGRMWDETHYTARIRGQITAISAVIAAAVSAAFALLVRLLAK